jgi:hypothetical protein
MKRDYTTGVAEAVTYFTGIEIEKTPAFGLKTLFVVGVQAPETIITIATKNDCDHLYFGANQSFDGKDISGWDQMIGCCLRLGYKCTLDFDVKFCTTKEKWLHELSNFDNFIPQISVKIPNLTAYNTNATIKIDDIDFKATNLGVWCHKLSSITRTGFRSGYTDWDKYANDEIIK